MDSEEFYNRYWKHFADEGELASIEKERKLAESIANSDQPQRREFGLRYLESLSSKEAELRRRPVLDERFEKRFQHAIQRQQREPQDLTDEQIEREEEMRRNWSTLPKETRDAVGNPERERELDLEMRRSLEEVEGRKGLALPEEWAEEWMHLREQKWLRLRELKPLTEDKLRDSPTSRIRRLNGVVEDDVFFGSHYGRATTTTGAQGGSKNRSGDV